MGFKVLHDLVAFKLHDEKEKTEGGIIIANTEEAQVRNLGTVTAVGPGRVDEKGNLQPVPLNVGDVILFPAGVWETLEVEGENICITQYGNIIGVFD